MNPLVLTKYRPAGLATVAWWYSPALKYRNRGIAPSGATSREGQMYPLLKKVVYVESGGVLLCAFMLVLLVVCLPSYSGDEVVLMIG